MNYGKASGGLIAILILLSMTPSIEAADDLLMDSLSIEGQIINNFVEINYTMVFDNSGSSIDKNANERFVIPDGMFLSNLSGSLGDETFYGVVKELSQAQQEFTEAVDENKTAILIEKHSNNEYAVSINVKAGLTLELTVYVVGYLIRSNGDYVNQFISFVYGTKVNFSFNLYLENAFSNFNTIKITGMGPATISETNGTYQIQFNSPDFIFFDDTKLSYNLKEIDTGSQLMTHTNGEENFFLYLLAPEIHDIAEQTAKEYIFVIDVSGSMGNANRIGKAKEAFTGIITNLNSIDRFNVISFSTGTNSIWISSQNANTDNIAAAITWVDLLIADGGTNINAALEDGLDDFNSDFLAARALTLLTDGVATSGVTLGETIRKNAQDANIFEARIFTIALGNQADEELMTGLAFDSGGEYIQIDDSDDVTTELLNFYSGFSLPVISDLSISYSSVSDIYPNTRKVEGAIFNGSEVIQTGKFVGQLTIETIASFQSGNVTYTHTAIEPENNPFVEKVWALNAVGALLDQIQNELDSTLKLSLEQELVDIALKYGLVVEGYTAIILILDEPIFDNQDEPRFTGEFIDSAKVPDAVDVIEVLGQEDAGFAPLDIVYVLLSLPLLSFGRKRYQNKRR